MLLPGQLRALVVDDNAYARAGLGATLRKLGLGEVVEIESASRVPGHLLERAAHILFLDWYMPDMNGGALLELIGDPRLPQSMRVPVVVTTAYPTRELVQRARDLGAMDVLTKPFNSGHVAALVARILPHATAMVAAADDDPDAILL